MRVLLILLTSMLFIKGASAMENNIKTAIFAGGCFWCVESDFDKVPGVIKTQSGYAGGDEKQVSYKQVSSGETGHTEVVKITYDANKVSYKDLVYKFFRTIDPTVKNRQFCDVGPQYRTAIFYQTQDEKNIAHAEKQSVEKLLKQKIYTQIEPLKNFNLAEEYHQDYYIKNPIRYKYYRYSCGRDARVKDIWQNTK